MLLVLKFMPPFLAYLLFYGLFVAAAGYFAYQVWKRLSEVAKGKSENRLDQVGKRVKSFFVYVVGQKRLLRDPWPGVAHAFIFWGFMILAAGYAVLFITAREVPESFLSGLFNGALANAYVLVQDVFAFLVLLGILYGLYNHFIRRYSRLSNNFDAFLVLAMILMIILTFFVSSGLRINLAGEESSLAPFTGIAASVLSGVSLETGKILYLASWWLHVILILAFLVYLPSSKHMHLVFSMPNVFLLNLKPRGEIPYIDIEKEESFGANRSEDLTWRSNLDAYTCVECGRCTAACPANATDKPLNPKKIINQLRNYLDDRRKGRVDEEGGIVGKYTSEDEIWSCTTCYACVQECPILIEHLDKIYAYRRHLALMEGNVPNELNSFFQNLEVRGNPWPLAKDTRAEWADDAPIKTFSSENKKADYLFFVGCAASFDDRNKKVAQGFARLMNAAGVDVRFLGVAEKCCGEPARRTGNEYLFQMMAMENIETFSQYEFKKIVTMCPHCYNTLKNEYPQLDGQYDVIHHTELLSDLISKGILKPSAEVKKKVTFHDSCYLGRYNNIYNQPRDVIKSIPGLELKEMEKKKSFSFCCGGGGGRVFMEETLGTRINQHRVKQAAEVKPDSLVSSCPYCLMMFSDGVEELELNESMEAIDIVELLESSVEEEKN